MIRPGSDDPILAALRGRSVLVTGARGFIGGALCRALLEAGAEVHGTTRGEIPQDEDSEAAPLWWRCDPAVPGEIESLLRLTQPEIIFHMSAAVTGSRSVEAVLPTLRDNLVSTVNILLAAAGRGVERVVLAGSVEAHAAPDEAPRSPYAASKAAATAYARLFDSLYDMRCVDIRIAMTYGPGQRDGSKLVPYVIEELRHGRAPHLGNGARLADWTYVDDIVSALVHAGVSKAALGRSIEVGTGITHSVRDVVQKLVDLIDPSVEPVYGALPPRPHELEAAVDTRPAWNLLNWVPRVTLDAGLRRTVEARLGHGLLRRSPRRMEWQPIGPRAALLPPNLLQG
jgi:nucleoside-diphosphate-sugar epimerase